MCQYTKKRFFKYKAHLSNLKILTLNVQNQLNFVYLSILFIYYYEYPAFVIFIKSNTVTYCSINILKSDNYFESRIETNYIPNCSDDAKNKAKRSRVTTLLSQSSMIDKYIVNILKVNNLIANQKIFCGRACIFIQKNKCS